MSTYSGNFKVINNTGGTITSVTVQHTCGSYAPVLVSEASMLNGDTSANSTTFESRTLYHDYWTVSFISAEGELMTAYNHCSFGSQDNGGTVVVTLADDVTVAPPVSSASSWSYDQS